MKELLRLIEADQRILDTSCCMTKYGKGYLEGLKRALELILEDDKTKAEDWWGDEV